MKSTEELLKDKERIEEILRDRKSTEDRIDPEYRRQFEDLMKWVEEEWIRMPEYKKKQRFECAGDMLAQDNDTLIQEEDQTVKHTSQTILPGVGQTERWELCTESRRLEKIYGSAPLVKRTKQDIESQEYFSMCVKRRLRVIMRETDTSSKTIKLSQNSDWCYDSSPYLYTSLTPLVRRTIRDSVKSVLKKICTHLGSYPATEWVINFFIIRCENGPDNFVFYDTEDGRLPKMDRVSVISGGIISSSSFNDSLITLSHIHNNLDLIDEVLTSESGELNYRYYSFTYTVVDTNVNNGSSVFRKCICDTEAKTHILRSSEQRNLDLKKKSSLCQQEHV